MICQTKRKEKTRTVVVFFLLGDKKINIETINPYFYLIEKNKIPHVVFVFESEITPAVKKPLETIHATCEIFTVKELQYNPTKHVLVPRHEKLSPEEMAQHTEIKKYPILKRHDPIARYYFYETGDLVRIWRKDGSIYFRVVR